LRMNAGAMGSWMFEVVETIRFMDYSGQVHEQRASEVYVEYRGCPLFKDHVALGAVLKGDATWAARILGARDAVIEHTGTAFVDRSVHALAERAERDVRARLGPDLWARAYAAGRGASIDSLLQDIESRRARS